MKKTIFLIVIAALFVSACGGGAKAPDTNALSTQIAATVNAALGVVSTSVPNVAPTKAPIVPPPAATKAPVAPAATKAPIVPPPASTKAPATGGGASFSPITFAMGENKEAPVDALDTFPGGVTMIYALFSGIKIKDGQAWSNEWYYNGELQDSISAEATWDAATAGKNSVWWQTLYHPDGIRTGTWELKLYIDGQLVQSGQITIEDNFEPDPDFGPITFAGGQKNDVPVDPVDVSDPTFSAGTKEVYAFWNGISVPKGTSWQSQWFLNGDQTTDPKDHTWNFGPTEQNWIQFGSTDGSPLAAGTYELKLTIGGNLVNIGSFVIAAK